MAESEKLRHLWISLNQNIICIYLLSKTVSSQIANTVAVIKVIKNLYKTTPNMGFNNTGWLRLNLWNSPIDLLFTQSLGQTFYFTGDVYSIKSCNLCT